MRIIESDNWLQDLENIKQSNRISTEKSFSRQLFVVNDFLIFSQEQFEKIYSSTPLTSFEEVIPLILLLDAIELHLEALASFKSAAYGASIALERAAYERLVLINYLEKNLDELKNYTNVKNLDNNKTKIYDWLTNLFGETPERNKKYAEYRGLCDFSHPSLFGQISRVQKQTEKMGAYSLYRFKYSTAERAILHIMSISFDIVKTETQMLQQRNADNQFLRKNRLLLATKLRKAHTCFKFSKKS